MATLTLVCRRLNQKENLQLRPFCRVICLVYDTPVNFSSRIEGFETDTVVSNIKWDKTTATLLTMRRRDDETKQDLRDSGASYVDEVIRPDDNDIVLGNIEHEDHELVVGGGGGDVV